MLNSNELMRIIKRYTQPMANRIAMLIGRCVLLATNDAQGIQKINGQVLAGEILDDIERFQNYGMTSVAPDNSEGVILFPLGNREHGICVSIDNRQFRLKNLAKGEVAIYTDEGDKIHFKRGNIIEVVGGSQVKVETAEAIVEAENATVNAATQADITAPIINLTGVVNVAGSLNVAGAGGAPTTMNMTGNISHTGDLATSGNVSDGTGSMQEIRDIYNTHTHNENNNPGGPTNAPNESM
jgi:phage baseplate assembly protein V